MRIHPPLASHALRGVPCRMTHASTACVSGLAPAGAQTPADASPSLNPDAPLQLLAGLRDRSHMAEIRQAVSGHPALAGRCLMWNVPPRAEDTPAAAARAAHAAASAGGVVLAIGGDSIINAAAKACLQRGVALGVASQGSDNVFSRRHGIAGDLGDALQGFVQALDSGLSRPVRAACVNGQIFLVHAGLGQLPGLLVGRDAPTRQPGLRRPVAVLESLMSLLKAHPGEVLRLRERDAQGRERQRMTLASALLVGSHAPQQPRVGLAGDDKACHHLVATTLLPQPLPWMVRLLWQAAFGGLREHGTVDRFACAALIVEASGWRRSDEVQVAFDGQRTRLRLPLCFSIVEQPLWLVAPEPTPHGLQQDTASRVVPAQSARCARDASASLGGGLGGRTADG